MAEGAPTEKKREKESCRRLELRTVLLPWLQRSHLKLSTVALLSLLHVAVATFLPAVEHLDLRHVEQAHADAFFKAGRQVLLAAAAEHRWERIPASDTEGWGVGGGGRC